MKRMVFISLLCCVFGLLSVNAQANADATLGKLFGVKALTDGSINKCDVKSSSFCHCYYNDVIPVCKYMQQWTHRPCTSVAQVMQMEEQAGITRSCGTWCNTSKAQSLYGGNCIAICQQQTVQFIKITDSNFNCPS